VACRAVSRRAAGPVAVARPVRWPSRVRPPVGGKVVHARPQLSRDPLGGPEDADPTRHPFAVRRNNCVRRVREGSGRRPRPDQVSESPGACSLPGSHRSGSCSESDSTVGHRHGSWSLRRWPRLWSRLRSRAGCLHSNLPTSSHRSTGQPSSGASDRLVREVLGNFPAKPSRLRRSAAQSRGLLPRQRSHGYCPSVGHLLTGFHPSRNASTGQPNKRLQLTAAVGGVQGGQPSGGRPGVRLAPALRSVVRWCTRGRS